MTKNLLVDLDGTLLGNRSVALSVDFASQALSTLKDIGGWRKTAKTLLAINALFKRNSKRLTNDVRVVNLFARDMKLDPAEARTALRNALNVVFPGLEKHFFPIPGAKPFLDWAKDHYTLTLATNPVWPIEIIHLRVLWAGIDPAIFSFTTHVKTMHACKPTPEYYQEILKLRGFKAEECLLVGNDLKMDLPATRVGIPVFIIAKTKKLTKLSLPGAKAPAWRGTYRQLKLLLESED